SPAYTVASIHQTFQGGTDESAYLAPSTTERSALINAKIVMKITIIKRTGVAKPSKLIILSNFSINVIETNIIITINPTQIGIPKLSFNLLPPPAIITKLVTYIKNINASSKNVPKYFPNNFIRGNSWESTSYK